MPSGGARARSGPAKDPNAVRRPNGTDVRLLPAGGREGDVPVWPLDGQSDRESVLWVELWAMPQAVVWEEQRLEWSVAMYVRALAAAEQLKASVPARTLVRQFMDDLGLTAGGMARNGWRIGPAVAVSGEVEKVAVSGAVEAGSVRDRLKLVTDGVA
jgi:hypothetical protein